jgi:hypothetical protein
LNIYYSRTVHFWGASSLAIFRQREISFWTSYSHSSAF